MKRTQGFYTLSSYDYLSISLPESTKYEAYTELPLVLNEKCKLSRSRLFRQKLYGHLLSIIS